MTDQGAGEVEYRKVVERAEHDPRVVGLVLTGSRGRNAFVRPESDWDVRLVVRDEALAAGAGELATAHGSPVEIAVFSLEAFAATGEIGSETEWDRYSYVHVPVVIDKLDGRITRLVAEKSILPVDQAPRVAAAALDDYINSYYRSLKNARVGSVLAAQLDAAESIKPLLTTLFALDGRVRPFHRFLQWELENFPLPGQTWAPAALLPRIASIVGSGSPAEQASLFRDVERLARGRGVGGVVDGWEPDVPWLRSGTQA